MKPVEPDRVKFFIGILYSDESLFGQALEMLHKKYGEIDFVSDPFPFDITDYYEPEMGSPIVRKFVSFERLIHPKELARIKIETNEVENLLTVRHDRKVNLDPGIMDYDKVVLASAKYNGQKIYLDHGIWADLTLHFEKNHFDPYPWSFPDFKKGLYNDIFLKIRQKYKGQRRKVNDT